MSSCLSVCFFFFFKQKTAYDLRISYWSSDVCSSDLFLSFCILVCLAVLGFLGFQSVTASPFFDVSEIEVRGTDRASKQDIERIVSTQIGRASCRERVCQNV